MGPTEQLARFVAGFGETAIAEDVRAAALRSIIDGVGAALAGSRQPAGILIAAQAVGQAGVPESTLWGRSDRVSAQSAALANGTACHALDFDDVSRSMPGHPTTVVLPAVWAEAERRALSGRKLVDAYIIGVEVACKLGRLIGPTSYDAGWHNTSTVGVVGATAGVSFLAGLDLDATRNAIGIAVSRASGARVNFGSMTKPLHAGLAAQAAIQAVELAGRGFTASEASIEGPAGFLALFGDGSDRELLPLGEPFDLVMPGFDLKLYPCCAATHAAIDSARECGRDINPVDIEQVDVEVPYNTPLLLIHHRPTEPLEAKFSLEYTTASALLDGTVDLNSFEQESVVRPEVQQLLRKVSYRTPPEWEADSGTWTLSSARLTLRLRDGSRRFAETIYPTGTAERPLMQSDLERKFLDCAATAVGAAGAARALVGLKALEACDDIREIVGFFAHKARSNDDEQRIA